MERTARRRLTVQAEALAGRTHGALHTLLDCGQGFSNVELRRRGPLHARTLLV